MGYDLVVRGASMHISGQDFVTAGWVGENLAALEYVYNIAASIAVRAENPVHVHGAASLG
jgi:hypothetical protein